MSQCDCLRKILIKLQGSCYGSGILCHLQRMSHTGPVMISLRSQKDLRFLLKTPKRFTMQDTVSVPLIIRADITLGLCPFPSSALICKAGILSQNLVLSLFLSFPKIFFLLHRDHQSFLCDVQTPPLTRQPFHNNRIPYSHTALPVRSYRS